MSGPPARTGRGQLLQAGVNDLGDVLMDENIGCAARTNHGQHFDEAELLPDCWTRAPDEQPTMPYGRPQVATKPVVFGLDAYCSQGRPQDRTDQGPWFAALGER